MLYTLFQHKTSLQIVDVEMVKPATALTVSAPTADVRKTVNRSNERI